MQQKITKRKKRVIITALLGVAVIAAIMIIMYLVSPSKKKYTPGEDIEGLTTELNRNVPEDYPRVTFVDAAKSAGIDFKHFNGDRTFQMPEDMGSGAAWGDYDGDGWLDLFIVNSAGAITVDNKIPQSSPATCKLYHNDRDGTFTDVSQQAGVDIRCWGMGAAWGDYDNDKRPDIFVSAYGKNYLFHNNGDGTFKDVSTTAGINGDEGFWSGGAWGDFNRDGYIDLYVCGYVQYDYQKTIETSLQYDVEVPASLNPSSFEPERNLLFQNNGNGTFTEIGNKAGVSNVGGRSLCAVWADFDNDELPDIYVANDVSDNALYKNSGDGTFQEISHNALVADYRGAMGIAVGDWDGDADFDIFLTHWIAQENALYSSLFTQLSTADNPLRELRFMDEADRFGLGQIALDFVGWGTSFFDYDNDTRPDLFVVNGSTFQQKENPKLLVPMRNQLFWNKGNSEGFFDVASVSGEIFGKEYVGRGAAFGDYDNDGDVDVFVVNNGGPAQLLRNDGGNKNNWLEVKLEGVKTNSNGLGAKLRVVANQHSQIQQAGSQGSYCSQNSPVQHFGLGQAAKVDTLEVIWTTGKRQVFYDLPVNHIIKIVEGKKDVVPL
jgi:enediyne biosynthesis protein E4